MADQYVRLKYKQDISTVYTKRLVQLIVEEEIRDEIATGRPRSSHGHTFIMKAMDRWLPTMWPTSEELDRFNQLCKMTGVVRGMMPDEYDSYLESLIANTESSLRAQPFIVAPLPTFGVQKMMTMPKECERRQASSHHTDVDMTTLVAQPENKEEDGSGDAVSVPTGVTIAIADQNPTMADQTQHQGEDEDERSGRW